MSVAALQPQPALISFPSDPVASPSKIAPSAVVDLKPLDDKKLLTFPSPLMGVQAAFRTLQDKLWDPVAKQVYRNPESFGAVLESKEVLRELTISLDALSSQLLSVMPQIEQERLMDTMYSMRGGDKSQPIETLFPARFVLTSFDVFYRSRVDSLSAQLASYPKSKEMIGHAWHVITALEVIGHELTSESPNQQKFSVHVQRLASNWPSYAVHYNQYLDALPDQKKSPEPPTSLKEEAVKRASVMARRRDLFYKAIQQSFDLDAKKTLLEYRPEIVMMPLLERRDRIVAIHTEKNLSAHTKRLTTSGYASKEVQEIAAVLASAQAKQLASTLAQVDITRSPEKLYQGWHLFLVAASQLLKTEEMHAVQVEALKIFLKAKASDYSKDHFVEALKFLDQVIAKV